MGVKVCLTDGCWQPTAGTRCEQHEREWQARRNKRRGAVRKPTAAYRSLSLAGTCCSCCGTTEDLTRHHVDPLARTTPAPRPFVVVPMCRRCNSSIGVRVMAGTTCPMHGGVEA